MGALKLLDRGLSRLARWQTLALAVGGVGLVGIVDFLTGYEISTSLFYLVPVALAAWYGGRWAGVSVAVLSCLAWYVADVAHGEHYSHPAIAVWNSLVRLGFFLISGLLLSALRKTLLNEQHMARTDDLTGLYGRRAFEDQLEHDLALTQRHTSAVTLAYLDLDDFKTLNDTRGHNAGDRALRTAGRVLERHSRRADTAARVGGDEFALILPDTDAQGAQEAVSHLTRELQNAFAAIDLDITCSVGVVTFLHPPASATSAVAAADALMYEVKRRGKAAVAYKVIEGSAPPSVAPESARTTLN